MKNRQSAKARGLMKDLERVWCSVNEVVLVRPRKPGIVVWDGSRSGPGGAQLVIPEEPRAVIPAHAPRRGPRPLSHLLPSERLAIAREVEAKGYRSAAEKWELTVSALYSIVYRVKQARGDA